MKKADTRKAKEFFSKHYIELYLPLHVYTLLIHFKAGEVEKAKCSHKVSSSRVSLSLRLFADEFTTIDRRVDSIFPCRFLSRSAVLIFAKSLYMWVSRTSVDRLSTAVAVCVRFAISLHTESDNFNVCINKPSRSSRRLHREKKLTEKHTRNK
jgi:hypothetical protein